jgi:hypothetical protein
MEGSEPYKYASGLTILGGGWVLHSSNDVDPLLGGVMARLLPAKDGQLEIRELHITRGSRLTPDQLREVRLGQIETWCNLEPARSMILERADRDSPDFEHFAELVEAERRKVSKRSRRPGKIQIPDGRGRYPDLFYQQVVAAYAELSQRERAPARALAELNEVPVTTVHRWLKEARRRELMMSPTWKGRQRSA